MFGIEQDQIEQPIQHVDVSFEYVSPKSALC